MTFDSYPANKTYPGFFGDSRRLVGRKDFIITRIMEVFQVKGGIVFLIPDKFLDLPYHQDVGPKFMEPLNTLFQDRTKVRIHITQYLEHAVWTDCPAIQMAVRLALTEE